MLKTTALLSLLTIFCGINAMQDSDEAARTFAKKVMRSQIQQDLAEKLPVLLHLYQMSLINEAKTSDSVDTMILRNNNGKAFFSKIKDAIVTLYNQEKQYHVITPAEAQQIEFLSMVSEIVTEETLTALSQRKDSLSEMAFNTCVKKFSSEDCARYKDHIHAYFEETQKTLQDILDFAKTK